MFSAHLRRGVSRSLCQISPASMQHRAHAPSTVFNAGASLVLMGRREVASSSSIHLAALQPSIFSNRALVPIHHCGFASVAQAENAVEYDSFEAVGSTVPPPVNDIAPATAASTLPATFDDITSLDAGLASALKSEFNYSTLTSVQSRVLSMIPMQTDLFVRARTGSGKTLAFLVPAFQHLLDAVPKKNLRGEQNTVRVLVISPTRELAQQIAVEAEKLLVRYRRDLHVLCTVGGTSRREQVRAIERGQAQIVIGTPGRLLDLMNNADFADGIKSLQTLVLDEADTLLDMGFRDELQAILGNLPTTRHSLLVSATVSAEVRRIASSTLSPRHEFIDCVEAGSEALVTIPDTIKQAFVTVPPKDTVAYLAALLHQHAHETKGRGKVMVFLPTTRGTMLYADMFRSLAQGWAIDAQPDETGEPRPMAGQKDKAPWHVHELHSNLTQGRRTHTSELFRSGLETMPRGQYGRRGQGPATRPQTGSPRMQVLVTSDVSARGVDYPDVTMVVQVGVPVSREQYVHRVGRTGRAGKSGRALLVLNKDIESNSAKVLGLDQLGLAQAPMIDDTLAPFWNDEVRRRVDKAASRLDFSAIRDAFLSTLGYYSSRLSMVTASKHTIGDAAAAAFEGFKPRSELSVPQELLTKLFGRDRSQSHRGSSMNRGHFGGKRQDSYNRRDSGYDGNSGSSGNSGRDGSWQKYSDSSKDSHRGHYGARQPARDHGDAVPFRKNYGERSDGDRRSFGSGSDQRHSGGFEQRRSGSSPWSGRGNVRNRNSRGN